MAAASARPHPFNQVFDAVVLGSGHAGFAATQALRASGKRVLLIGPRGDLVWESGRSFCPDAGTCEHPAWNSLVAAVDQRGGKGDGWLDGAITEVVATDQLMAGGATVLYYATPVAVEREGDAVTSLIVATKSGLRRVAGRQWIDATESGDLLRLIDPSLRPRTPAATRIHLMLQHADWSKVNEPASLRPTAWPTERVLSVEVAHGDAAWRDRVIDALGELESALGGDIAQVSMSHLSIEPVSSYDAGGRTATAGANVVSASPGFTAGAIRTLADRFALGVAAVEALGGVDVHEMTAGVLSRQLPGVEPSRIIETDVCVAGAGTGGALAALASAKAGAKVVCVEPLAFVGGIGAGGGIHSYYFGVAGGLQQAVDDRTRDLMKRFAGGPMGDGPFNPWAKMIAVEQMLREAGVNLHTGAMLFAVNTEGGRVSAVDVAVPGAVIRIKASAYIDGTGDGDLCAMAGAQFTFGREQDGIPHAYSQSSGRLRNQHDRPRMAVVNFDAGWCDPTDPVDFTRARLTGVRQYLVPGCDNYSRPTYIAPAIGLRQARQVVTEHILTLDDQIHRRRFDDPIGYTGCHYDNHATDYEFESDEALFWVWVNRRWRFPYACEMSYRMLVPKGLDNVWIASRCFGVSQDAHHSCRMQRDLQRAGEAAGFAAAEASRRGEASLQLPYAELRKWLDQTGALDKAPRDIETGFGVVMKTDELAVPDELKSAAEALASLDQGEPGQAIWWLYRREDLVRDQVAKRLHSDKPMVSWLAAGLLAMWGDASAEPRLIHAITTREYGYGEGYAWTAHGHGKWDATEPLKFNRLTPNWLCAVAMLRRCGTAACLPALDDLMARPVHGVNTLTTIAVTLDRLARRGVLSNGDAAKAAAMLDRMLDIRLAGTHEKPQRATGALAQRTILGELDASDALAEPVPFGRDLHDNTVEDFTWQLHLAIAQARASLGLPMHEAAQAFLHDDRALVRRAFEAAAAQREPAAR
jgi:hypothetical protein